MANPGCLAQLQSLPVYISLDTLWLILLWLHSGCCHFVLNILQIEPFCAQSSVWRRSKPLVCIPSVFARSLEWEVADPNLPATFSFVVLRLNLECVRQAL